MIASILSWFLGGGLSRLTGSLERAYQAKLTAKNSEQRMAAEIDIERLHNAVSMAQIANADRWSATSLGRYLIVLPFGCWWAMIFADSIFSFEWDVLALPPDIMSMSSWLVPTIVVGDLGKSLFRRIR